MKVKKIGQKSSAISKKEALKIAEKIFKKLEGRAVIAGSLLRGHETVNDLDIVLIADSMPEISSPIALNVFLTDEESFEACLLHYAIGKAIIQMKSAAKAKGLKLNQYGLWKGDLKIASSIHEIYQALNKEVPIWLRNALNHPKGLYARDKSKKLELVL